MFLKTETGYKYNWNRVYYLIATNPKHKFYHSFITPHYFILLEMHLNTSLLDVL